MLATFQLRQQHFKYVSEIWIMLFKIKFENWNLKIEIKFEKFQRIFETSFKAEYIIDQFILP